MKKTPLIVGALLLAACASNRHDTEVGNLTGRTDRAVWENAQKYMKKRRWVDARQQFKRVVDAFPNSEYAPQARLGLGDTYFQDGGTSNYILAISEYRQFLSLFPSHPQSDYAQFQIAESYFKQKNGPDRDQTPTQQALEEYGKVLELHPTSALAANAKARTAECRQVLARGEFMVGHFYQRTRKAYRSAVLRYQGLLAEYPEYAQIDEVLLRLGECLHRAGRDAEAAPYLARLTDDHPQSQFVGEARNLLKEIEAAPPTPTPRATPEPAAEPTPRPTPTTVLK